MLFNSLNLLYTKIRKGGRSEMELADIKGLGPKKILLFHKLGIETIEDLITNYPYQYRIWKRSDMKKVKDGNKVIIDGVVENSPTVSVSSNRIKRILFRISTLNNIYQVCVFNQEYLCHQLHTGIKVIVIGKFDLKRNLITAEEVRIGTLPPYTIVEPIYLQTEGLNTKTIFLAIQEVLEQDFFIKDYLPKSIQEKYHFLSKNLAIKEMHQPTSTLNYQKAKQRLKYEEIFFYLLKIQYLKRKREKEERAITRNIPYQKVEEFISTLPFELTKDQLETVKSIWQDLTAAKRMNRFVQGDVGSGKTIVAFIATYMNYLSHYQTALMVPTEILATQHYQNAKQIFQGTKINISLLTSSTSKKEKNQIYQKLERGELEFIIGTQSLIQENLQFSHLGLIIADEQHRFGVKQREQLKNKGITPDVLSMSATPIPRTYALTLYGDMDISSIKTKPKGRKEIITIYRETKQIKDVLYQMKEELSKNHQIYVIAPSIEEEEELNNVELIYQKMKIAFGKMATIGMVHGKMKSEGKDKMMKEFEQGSISILISTTVIEVGVNVPNASMMVIFQANLFGLSTLHQLRGRVGRGNIQSYCILISDEPNERLSFLEKTNDGFLVSEYDFKTRGQGDLFGIRQSGDILFKLADMKKDYPMMIRVQQDLFAFLKQHKNEDLELKEYLKELNLLD